MSECGLLWVDGALFWVGRGWVAMSGGGWRGGEGWVHCLIIPIRIYQFSIKTDTKLNKESITDTFQNHEIVQRIKFLLTFVLNLAENVTVLVT